MTVWGLSKKQAHYRPAPEPDVRCDRCKYMFPPLATGSRRAAAQVEADRQAGPADTEPVDDDRYEETVVRATWQRRFPFVSILAFADHTYIILVGSDHKEPLVEI